MNDKQYQISWLVDSFLKLIDVVIKFFPLQSYRKKYAHDPYKDATTVERYSVVIFALSIMFWILSDIISTQYQFIRYVFVILALFWIIELVVYQVDLVFFSAIRSAVKGKMFSVNSYTLVVILLILNYFTIIMCFAILYRVFSLDFVLSISSTSASEISSLNGSLFYSVVTMMSVGYGDIVPLTLLGRFLSMLQIIIGNFFVIIIFARFVTLLAKPITQNSIEQHMNIMKKRKQDEAEIKSKLEEHPLQDQEE